MDPTRLEIDHEQDEVPDALGCLWLGLCCRDGIGVDQDTKRAVELYRMPCDARHMPACGALGRCYWFGIGVPADREACAKLLREACASKEEGACSLLQKAGIKRD